MSANENRRVVERLLTAFTDRDLESAKRALAQDFVNHDPPRLPGVGTDRAGVLAAIEYLHSAFAGARAEPVTILAEGDKVAVHDRLRGTHRGDFLGIPPTGRDVTVHTKAGKLRVEWPENGRLKLTSTATVVAEGRYLEG